MSLTLVRMKALCVALHFLQFWSARLQQSVLASLREEPQELQFQINLPQCEPEETVDS